MPRDNERKRMTRKEEWKGAYCNEKDQQDNLHTSCLAKRVRSMAHYSCQTYKEMVGITSKS